MDRHGWKVLAVFSFFLSCCGAALAQAMPPRLPGLLSADGLALGPDWRVTGFPQRRTRVPVTLFEAGEVDGQPAVRVETDASYGALVHAWQGQAPGRLQWLWRLDQPLAGGRPPDLTIRSGNDAALKVCVMFDHPWEQVPFLDRAALRIARAVSGERLSTATVCYLWDSGRPATLQGTSPHTRRVRFFSVQGKGSPLGQWVGESRDVAQDFITLFADELPGGKATPKDAVPPVIAVAIGADSDDTASRSTGWIAGLGWSAAER